jgi:type I restriction enzyme S subunit
MTFPCYPDYKDSGVEWLGEVPEHWNVKRLKHNLQLLTEKTDRRENAVALENIEGWSGRFIQTETTFEGEGIAFERGDILFGKLRPYLAKAYLAETCGEAVGDFHVMRPINNTIGRFVQYQILNREFIAIVDGSTFGAKMPRASWDFLGNMVLATPPIHEQKTIAHFLDRETAKIDVLIAEQQRLIELLKEKRQAVISHAVTKGLNPGAPMKDSGIEWLGEVPAHWNIIRIGALFKDVTEEGIDELPVLQVSIHHGVSDREINEEELDRKVSRSDDRSKYKQVQPDDLVYNMMRAWQGGFGTVTVRGMVSPAYVVARPIAQFSTRFIECQLRTPNAVEEMRRHSQGVTDFRLRLYWEEFKTLQISLPPIEEQKGILSFLDNETTKLDTLTAEAQRSIDLLKERRTALISAAVTGKIDVRGLIQYA